MTVRRVGDDLTTKIRQPGFPLKSVDESNLREIRDLYVVDRDSLASETPPIGDPFPDAPDTDLTLFESNPRAGPDPGSRFLELVYRDPVFIEIVGTVTQEADVSTREVPIEQIKKAGGAPLSQSEIELKKAQGIETEMVATLTYRRTDIKSSFTFSEANLTDGIGKIDDTPTGISSPTAGRWVKMGQNVRKTKANVEVQEMWQYDSNGWDAVLFG